MSRVIIIPGCLLYLIWLSLSCSNSNHDTPISSNSSDQSYKVYKIDSLKNYYLIYAFKKGIRYKIISLKQSDDKCKKIQYGGYYNFDLRSMLANELIAGGAGCINIEEMAKICTEPEDSIYDLSHSKNIKGLCFEKGK